MTIFPYSVVGLLLLQAVGTIPIPNDWGVLLNGGLAGLVFYFYRLDRVTLTTALDRNSKALEGHTSELAAVRALIESQERRRNAT